MKNINSIFKILLAIISIMSITSVYGQQDSISKKQRSIRNGIFINPTPAMIYSIWDFTPGYERVHKTKDRSWVITAGPFILSTMADSMVSSTVKKVGETRQGIHVGTEYRFYVRKRNKGRAPDGLYWGPYAFYNYSKNSLQLDLYSGNTYLGQGTYNFEFQMGHLGIQVGYQLIFAKRFSLDMIFIGPSLGFYGAKNTYDSNMNDTQKQELIDALTNEYPDKIGVFNSLYQKLHAGVGEGKIFFGGGYRYSFRLGYRF